MEKRRLGFGVAGAIALMLAVVACAPRSGGPTEGAEGMAADSSASPQAAAPQLVPVSVDVAFTGIDSGECTYEMKVDGVATNEVTLHKDPANGANEATWKFTGADFKLAWVILLGNGLDQCLTPLTNFPKGPKGFEIMPRGTTETTIDKDTCATGTYAYGLRAKKGANYCGADPTVKIED